MRKILGVMLTVSNLERMITFFTTVLSFKIIGKIELTGKAYDSLYQLDHVKAEFAILKLENEYLYLIAFNPPGKPFPDIQSNNLIFQHMAMVVSDIDKVHRNFAKYDVHAISAYPIKIPESNKPAAGIQAYYFRSPEGHPLELIYFPLDKGRDCWHERGKTFLGMDHTAIVVSDTESSLHYYGDELGMSVFGGSLNEGETQESLSGVKGARVKITGLGYPNSKGMGLEFLHYLYPVAGSKIMNLKANDLGRTYTVIEVEQLDQVQQPPSVAGYFMPHATSVKHQAIMSKDPDGHHIIFVNKEPCHAN